MDHAEFEKIVEIISDQLYFAVLSGSVNKKLKSTVDTFFFTTDDEYIYHNYYCDFGPLNISCVYKYCCKLNKYLQYAKGLKRVVQYTSSKPEKKTNAAFLIGSFSVIYLNIHPKEIYRILLNASPYKSFLDASQSPYQYTLKLCDCLQAFSKALTFRFFDFNDFNSAEYDMYDKLQYGDMNWLIPRKFLAFIGPTDSELLNGHPPDFYVKYFLKNDVKTVIRLNNKFYDSKVFTRVGIEHFDLIFPDGSTPPRDILMRFLDIVETAPAAIAVHCKAGLGRTGSLIGAYIIKHYRLTAREAIAWMRICRPGSVIGQQQEWLEKIESWLWRQGSEYRVRRYGEGDKIPRHRYGIYSKQWPLEREKILREARKRLQTTFTKSQLEKITGDRKRQTFSEEGMAKLTKSHKSGKGLDTNERSNFKGISKLLSSVHGFQYNADKSVQNITRIPSQLSSIKMKKHNSFDKSVGKSEYCSIPNTSLQILHQEEYHKSNNKAGTNRSKNNVLSDSRDYSRSSEIKLSRNNKTCKSHQDSINDNITQGDRLMKIKLNRYYNFAENDMLNRRLVKCPVREKLTYISCPKR